MRAVAGGWARECAVERAEEAAQASPGAAEVTQRLACLRRRINAGLPLLIEGDADHDVVHGAGERFRRGEDYAITVVRFVTGPAEEASTGQLQRCLPDVLERDRIGAAAEPRIRRARRRL